MLSSRRVREGEGVGVKAYLICIRRCRSRCSITVKYPESTTPSLLVTAKPLDVPEVSHRLWSPRQESNLYLALRRNQFYMVLSC